MRQLDVRVTRTLMVGAIRVQPQFDLYNARGDVTIIEFRWCTPTRCLRPY
jgi:hypothetical protein